MKRWIIALVVLFAVPSFAATTVNFTWIPNPASDEITGYRLYMDGGNADFMVQSILNPAANSTSYIIVNDTVPHTFSLDAWRQSDGEFSQQSTYAIWTPPVAGCPECPECPPPIICPECPPPVVCPERRPLSFSGEFKLVEDSQ